jgi:integrase
MSPVAGLDGLTFHHLRHSAVGLMIDVGAHPKAIQDRLGHSSVRTTMDVYGHVLPTTDDAITQALDVAFSESRGLSAACDETGTHR